MIRLLATTFVAASLALGCGDDQGGESGTGQGGDGQGGDGQGGDGQGGDGQGGENSSTSSSTSSSTADCDGSGVWAMSLDADAPGCDLSGTFGLELSITRAADGSHAVEVLVDSEGVLEDPTVELEADGSGCRMLLDSVQEVTTDEVTGTNTSTSTSWRRSTGPSPARARWSSWCTTSRPANQRAGAAGRSPPPAPAAERSTAYTTFFAVRREPPPGCV